MSKKRAIDDSDCLRKRYKSLSISSLSLSDDAPMDIDCEEQKLQVVRYIGGEPDLILPKYIISADVIYKNVDDIPACKSSTSLVLYKPPGFQKSEVPNDSWDAELY